jgi:hypothetical protein
MPITAKQKAIAAEALIRVPGLSPAARRVGLELLNAANRATGISWPSEARMAEALGVDPRTVRRGKADLRAAGLLTWEQRGHHRTPVYRLLWDRLVQLAASIKARVTAACQAARKATATAKPSTPPPSPPPINKRPENGPARSTGRTFSSTYFTHQGFKGAWEGKGSAPAAPLRTTISETELNARASARFWKALQALGPQVMAQFIAHPQADELQDRAIRAERFKPDHGRTGITTLHQLLHGANA